MPTTQPSQFSAARIIGAAAFVLVLTLAYRPAAALGGCGVFPPDNVWNTAIDTLDRDPLSDAYIDTQGGVNVPLHPDFGTVYQGAPIGIPYVVVPASQPLVPIILTPYGDEADPGPYPVPPNAPVEGGRRSNGDRHVLVLQQGTCTLYEMYRAFPLQGGAAWRGFGAIFDLNVNGPLRTDGYTSADAAGLPILPGLVKYTDVVAALAGDGVIHHALRFTVPNSRDEHIWPARHSASDSNDPNRPPMGMRFRMKASVNIDTYPGTGTPVSAMNKVILRTLKTYGMFVADNGSAWFLSGAPDPRWNDDDLHLLTNYSAGDFEAVDESVLMIDPDSGQAVQQPHEAGDDNLL